MTSKNFNRVLTVVVNKLNKCYFNFTKPENMKSVTIEKSTFLVEHGLMYVTCADVPGYMNEGCSTVHAYNGKYGKGVVRTRPCFYKGRRSTNYMTIEYWVKGELNDTKI